MTLRIREPSVTLRGVRARENREFDEIIKLPDESDSGSGQGLISLTDVRYNPATLTEISDVLDGDGQCLFEANYYIDMEAANRANVRKVRFEIYTKDPTPRLPTALLNSPSTRTAINRAFQTSMGSRGQAAGGGGQGPAAARVGQGAQSAACKTDPSGVQVLDRGLVKEFERNTSVTDGTVQLMRNVERDLAVQPRRTGTQVNVVQAINNTLSSTAQVYTTLIAPNVEVRTPTAGSCELTARALIGASTNLIDGRLTEGSRAKFLESNQVLGQKALLGGSDPVAHLNMFYASGPTASGGSPSSPIKYGQAPTIQNEVDTSRRGREADNSFQSIRDPKYQARTTQRAPSFRGDSNLEALYRKSATISPSAALQSQFSNIPIRQLSFRSTLRQCRDEFDIPISSLQPKSNQYIWVRIMLLDRDGKTLRERTFRVDVRYQLKGVLTPVLPPTLKMISQSEGRFELEVEQTDPLSTDVTIYRMVSRPDDLAESSWTRVADLRANTRRGAFRYIDSDITANVSPNVVLYEARCSGLFGSICPTTTRMVQLGVKRITNLTGSKRQGVCNIVATQSGNRIEIRVSRVPAGVTRIFLRRQTVNSSLRERDFRKQVTVRAQGTGNDYHEVRDASGAFVFEDNSVVNRQVYRYFAQFDWTDRERTNSVTEEYVEYRTVPERPIISYLDGVESGIDTLGRSFVSFDLGATFSDAGLEELNRILGDNGVSNIFTDELKKDRSLISNLLLFQVTRRDTRAGESVVWPLVQEGRFVDSAETRAGARGTTNPGIDTSLRAGAEYLYTARLHIVNPERFFKEALTRLPASTRQIITDTDPNFIRVSAAKFADNFSVQPGTIQSPTTLERETKFSDEVQGAYTGLSYTTVINIPTFKAVPRRVSAVRSATGRRANVIKWQVEGSIETVYQFQVDVTVGRENTFPLRSVSPSISEDGYYEVRDELFADEISSVSYAVRAIYTDMSTSQPVKSNEIYTGSSIPVRILSDVLKRQLTLTPQIDLSRLNRNTLDALQAEDIDPLAVSPLVDPNASDGVLQSQIEANRNILNNSERTAGLLANNPIRKLRGS